MRVCNPSNTTSAVCQKAGRFFKSALLPCKQCPLLKRSFANVMTPDDITQAFTQRFGAKNFQHVPPDAWQVELDGMRLLAIMQGEAVKLMTPIMSVNEAQPFIQQMMEANFDDTQSTRYALHQNVVWGIFQYDLDALSLPQFETATDQLLKLKADGSSVFFSRMVETQLTQIIVASKKQGQSLEGTLKTLDRFYAEGMMGDMSQNSGEYQQNALASWRRQLERLWPLVDVDGENQEAGS